MGLCASVDDSAEATKSRQLEASLKQQYVQEQSKIKLLLLGCGESGKSTIFKQMRILYGSEKTNEELLHFRDIVRTNCLTLIVVLCTFVQDKLDLTNLLSRQERKAHNEMCDAFDTYKDSAEQSNALSFTVFLPHIRTLWNSEAFQAAHKRRAETNAIDGHHVFLHDMDRIGRDDYIPTEADMLLSRVRTEGVVTHSYEIPAGDGSAIFEMYDVGGQRYFRKTWLHCFDAVDAIIFVASLSEYDQNLAEDRSKNRMMEAIDLFKSICENEYFENTSIMLFLNKKDLFQTKILSSNISAVSEFSNYYGPKGDYDSGVEYFMEKFLEVNEDPSRAIYTHVTCATDTNNVEFVWASCKDIILQQNIGDSGL